MKLPLSKLPPQYDHCVEGVEPASTTLEPILTDSLLGELKTENRPIQLTEDLTDEKIAGSAFVSNAVASLRATADGDRLRLTTRGKPSSAMSL